MNKDSFVRIWGNPPILHPCCERREYYVVELGAVADGVVADGQVHGIFGVLLFEGSLAYWEIRTVEIAEQGRQRASLWYASLRHKGE